MLLREGISVDSPVSNTYMRELLGWNPVYPTLLEDLGKGDYFSPEAVSAFDKAAR